MGALLVPEPTYAGPSKVIYFRGEQGLSDELSAMKATWLVAFYTAWNPVCVSFAPVFAKLSSEYGIVQYDLFWLVCLETICVTSYLRFR